MEDLKMDAKSTFLNDKINKCTQGTCLSCGVKGIKFANQSYGLKQALEA